MFTRTASINAEVGQNEAEIPVSYASDDSGIRNHTQRTNFFECINELRNDIKMIKDQLNHSPKTRFAGICYVCQKRGHNAMECRSRDKRTSKVDNYRFQGECRICHRRGQKANECHSRNRSRSFDHGTRSGYTRNLNYEHFRYNDVQYNQPPQFFTVVQSPVQQPNYASQQVVQPFNAPFLVPR